MLQNATTMQGNNVEGNLEKVAYEAARHQKRQQNLKYEAAEAAKRQQNRQYEASAAAKREQNR